MAGKVKVVSMEDRLLAVFTAGLKSVNVSRLCSDLGISRQSFYKYRRRYAEEGPAGLVERSRRPRSSPGQVDAAVEDEIVRLRKQLAESGSDCGAQTIFFLLSRKGWGKVPSVATIHRVLTRRGLVTPQPEKRPSSAGIRFVYPQPNDAWQIDATSWVLSSGQQVWILNTLDDHSRLMTSSMACPPPTSEAAWEALCRGGEEFGLPARVISDNGSYFTGRRLSGGEVLFERNLKQAGIHHICSTPGHPQTCGKLERAQQTEKKWLKSQAKPRTLGQLQEQLDIFRPWYNQQRPHRALGGATPLEAWQATPRAAPGEPIPTPGHTRLVIVDRYGRFSWGSYVIHVGAHLAGSQLVVIANQLDLTILGADRIVRRLTIDPHHRYQASGLPPGGVRRRQIGPCN